MNDNENPKITKWKRIGISLFAIALIGGGVGYASYSNNNQSSSDKGAKIVASDKEQANKKSSPIERAKGKKKEKSIIDSIKKELKESALDIIAPKTLTNAIEQVPTAKKKTIDRSSIKKEMAAIDTEIKNIEHKKSEDTLLMLAAAKEKDSVKADTLSNSSKSKKGGAVDELGNKDKANDIPKVDPNEKPDPNPNVDPNPNPNIDPNPNPNPNPNVDPIPDPDPKPDSNVPEKINASKNELGAAKNKAEALTGKMKAIQDELHQLSTIEESTKNKADVASQQWTTVEMLVIEYRNLAKEMKALIETDGTVSKTNQNIYQTTYNKLFDKVNELKEAQTTANKSTETMNQGVAKAKDSLDKLEETKVTYEGLKQEKQAVNTQTNQAVDTAVNQPEVAKAVQPEINQAVQANDQLNDQTNAVSNQLNSVNQAESQQQIDHAQEATSMVNYQATTQNQAVKDVQADFANYPAPEKEAEPVNETPVTTPDTQTDNQEPTSTIDSTKGESQAVQPTQAPATAQSTTTTSNNQSITDSASIK